MLQAIQDQALGSASEEQTALLETLGFASSGRLTPAGEYVEDAHFIEQDPQKVAPHLTESYRRLPIVQALLQGFHGRGAVSVSGIMYFLRRHGFAASSNTVTELRNLLQALNSLGILSYSKKHQTVRVIAPVADEADPPPAIRVVEPERPYSNLKHLREILRSARQYIYWAEPHLDRKVLEPLVDEADGDLVDKILLLSGPANVSTKLRKDFSRFADEMQTLSIEAQWRVVGNSQRDWHDRFILTKDNAWNVPPLNTLYKGDYSEAFTTTSRPPFARWWQLATPLDEWPD